MNGKIIRLGESIDKLDILLIRALTQRIEIAKKIEIEKRKLDAPIVRHEIEEKRMEACVAFAKEVGYPSLNFIRGLFSQIYGESIKAQLAQREKAEKEMLNNQKKD